MPDGTSAPTNDPSAEDRAKIDAAIVAFMASENLQVPPLPHVALKLQALVASDKYSSKDLAQIVRADQVLSAIVLRYANRSAALRSTPIVDLDEAITRLGARELVDVAFGATLGKQASQDGLLLPVRRLVWQQAVVSAILSRLLAPKFKVSPEIGFLGGLLHDFGKVLALGAVEKIVDEKSVEPASVGFWVSLIESYHVELGTVAAERWALPEPMPSIIGTHHSPEAAGDARDAVDLINFSDMIAAKMAAAPHLTESDVAALAAVTGGRVDAKALQRAIEELPGAVSALTSMGNAPKKNAPTLVRKDPVSEAQAIGVNLVVKKGKDEHAFVVTHLDHDGLHAVGDAPLPEGFIAKAVLSDDDGEIELFLNVTQVAQTDRIRIVAAPFGAGGEIARNYTQMVRRHQTAKAA